MKFDIYEYVKKYFQQNFPEYYLIFKEDGLSYAQNRYNNEVFQKKICAKYDASDIKSGNVNTEIKAILGVYVDEYFTKKEKNEYFLLCDYVKKYLIIKGINENYSNDMFDHIVKLVSSEIWPQYDSSKLNTAEFNQLVNKTYDGVYNKLVEQINKKVRKFIALKYKDTKVDGFGVISLEESVVSAILINEERDFLTKLNSLIVAPDRELSETGIKVDNYINSYIFRGFSNNERVVNTSKTNENKVQDKNVGVKYNRESMKNNSVQRKDAPKKIKSNSKRTVMVKAVVSLALLGTLVGVGAGVNNYIQEKNDKEAVMIVESAFGFDYAKPYLRTDQYYNDMADNIIIFYSKLGQLDEENYKTLGFYNAYDGFRKVNSSNALSSMETFFSLVKNKMVKEDIKEGLRETIHADSVDSYFYLDFVYDTLDRAGFEEIKDKKYQDVLLRYKYTNFGQYYGVVGVTLNEEENAILSDVMSKYVDYCEKSKVNLGYIMGEGKYSFFASYTGSSGKGK